MPSSRRSWATWKQKDIIRQEEASRPKSLFKQISEARKWKDIWPILMQSSSMSTDEQLQLLDITVQKLFPYKGHPMQLEMIWQLLFNKVDIILIAKTSFRKSMILQAISTLI